MPAARARSRTTDRSELGGTMRFVLMVAILAWLFRSLVFAPFSIPSGSMLPTLFIGDYVAVAKWRYGFSHYSFPFGFPPFGGRILSHLPRRGDVAVFVPPGEEGVDYVKRVIGLPGDTIEVRNGRLILNGRPVEHSPTGSVAIPLSANSPCRIVPGARRHIGSNGTGRICIYPSYRETLANGISYSVIDQVQNGLADNFQPVRVPAGHVFMMGDNRDDSLDSRFSQAEGGIGFVPVENLIGPAVTTIWSTDGSASYLKPWTWVGALRGQRIGKGFGKETR